MASINFATREISCKIVYYGPGRSGKTTNLEWIHAHAPAESVGDLAAVATESDRTLFFDFLSLDLGQIAGMKTKFQLYTVPGQVYYDATRKIVLEGADGVVFVADSHPDMVSENLESLANLQQNLIANNIDPDTTPLVMQWNKRDLENAVPVEEMAANLNGRGLPAHEAIAIQGEGVFQALKEIASLVIRKLNKTHDEPPAAASGVESSQAAADAELGSKATEAAAVGAKEPVMEEDMGSDLRQELLESGTSGQGTSRRTALMSARARRSERGLGGRLLAGLLGVLAVFLLQVICFWPAVSGPGAGWAGLLESTRVSTGGAYVIMSVFLLVVVVVCVLAGVVQERHSWARCFELSLAWFAVISIGLTVARVRTPAEELSNPDAIKVGLRMTEMALTSIAVGHAAQLAQAPDTSGEMETLQTHVQELETERETLKQEAKGAATQLAQIQTQVQALEAERDTLTKESEQLKGQLQELESAQNEPPAEQ